MNPLFFRLKSAEFNDKAVFYGHSPPFPWIIQEGLLSVTSEKYVHEVLVNCLFKLAQEKEWLDELTVRPWQ